MDVRRIEAIYVHSPYIQEFCLVSLPVDGRAGASQAHGVVVPNIELTRRRGIVNVGDLLRFEIEGRSIELPREQRIDSYDIWFEPLPRTAAGEVDREQVARRVAERLRRAGQRTSSFSPDSEAAAAVLESLAPRAPGGIVARDDNLEIDLGVDSLSRVEIISQIEHRLGVRVSHRGLPHALTVSELIDVFVSTGAPAERVVAANGRPWAAILEDLPGADSDVGFILKRRTLTIAALFALLRLGRLLAPPISVSGRQHLPGRGPCIIAPNHQSYLDPFFLCAVLPFAVLKQVFVVGATEYFETPLTAWLARQCNLVPVDPDVQLVPAMKAAAFGLAHGRILLMFPEGERSIDGRVKRFKKGAAILSQHLDVPVVPVAIRGVYDVWPRNRRFNWRALIPGGGLRVHIAFGAPMRWSAHESYAVATEALRDRVESLWNGLPESA